MHLIELSNYSLAPTGSGNGLDGFYLALSKGDIYSIQTDLIDDASNLLRALATLTHPIKGAYLFMGEKLDFSDYRKLLPYKKKIGYIAPDSAMKATEPFEKTCFLKEIISRIRSQSTWMKTPPIYAGFLTSKKSLTCVLRT